MRVKGSFRSTVVACLLAGVVLVSSGFAVVSGAKVAKPGGVCGKAGARVVSQSVSLVCKKKGVRQTCVACSQSVNHVYDDNDHGCID